VKRYILYQLKNYCRRWFDRFYW